MKFPNGMTLQVDSEDSEPISDWERYAAEEYEMLVSEDAASEDL
jgi:hypothetical protein